jgi:hypothetical protein
VAIPSVATFWRLSRRTERLFDLEDGVATSLKDIDERLAEMDRRIARVEADQRAVIAEARGAAAATGSAMAAQAVADISRRLGVLEERTRAAAPAGPRRSRLTAPKARRDDD